MRLFLYGCYNCGLKSGLSVNEDEAPANAGCPRCHAITYLLGERINNRPLEQEFQQSAAVRMQSAERRLAGEPDLDPGRWLSRVARREEPDNSQRPPGLSA